MNWTFLFLAVLGMLTAAMALAAFLQVRDNNREIRRMMERQNDEMNSMQAAMDELNENQFLLYQVLYEKGVVDEEEVKEARERYIEKPRQEAEERAELENTLGAHKAQSRITINSGGAGHSVH
ncbi:MAG: hypothetical protein GMKNLPBB_01496 [Myxococcota bacterium]|nr:hypothetical protein [Myxococcota bacterium]